MSDKTLLNTVVFNDLKKFKTLLNSATKNDKRDALMEAARRGKTEYIALLLPVPSPLKRSALLEAVIYGHLPCVQILLPHPIRDSEALCGAVRHNRPDIFDFLLPIVPLASHTFMALRACLDPNSTHSHMFPMFQRVLDEAYMRHPQQLQSDFSRIVSATVYQGDAAALTVLLQHPLFTKIGADDLALAIDKSHSDCVGLLLPHATSQSCNAALIAAARFDDQTMIELLLPRADPCYDNSAALKFATVRGNQKIFDLLYPVSNPQAALAVLQEKWKDQPHLWSMLEDRIRRDLRETLDTTTQYAHIQSAPARKM